MALYTDGPISSIEELTARDSQLLSVASTEGIDLAQKMALAQDELGLELCGMLTAAGSLLSSFRRKQLPMFTLPGPTLGLCPTERTTLRPRGSTAKAKRVVIQIR